MPMQMLLILNDLANPHRNYPSRGGYPSAEQRRTQDGHDMGSTTKAPRHS